MTLCFDPDLERFKGLLRRTSYPKLKLEVLVESGTFFLRCYHPNGRCNRTGERLPWKGRKWRLSQHMTDGEVVWTAFKAILTALEHEARELFKFDGVSVADSHVDIHKLVELHRQEGAIVERAHGPTSA